MGRNTKTKKKKKKKKCFPRFPPPFYISNVWHHSWRPLTSVPLVLLQSVHKAPRQNGAFLAQCGPSFHEMSVELQRHEDKSSQYKHTFGCLERTCTRTHKMTALYKTIEQILLVRNIYNYNATVTPDPHTHTCTHTHTLTHKQASGPVLVKWISK